jgi:hypothetical protein
MRAGVVVVTRLGRWLRPIFSKMGRLVGGDGRVVELVIVAGWDRSVRVSGGRVEGFDESVPWVWVLLYGSSTPCTAFLIGEAGEEVTFSSLWSV